jgi:hypothetical protein
MTENISARIDNYLFGEMNAQDHEKFESAMLENDEVYFEVVERENDLVDRYVARSLDKDVSARFERSLSAFPARRQKLANAKTLKNFISETNAYQLPEQAKEPWYRRLGFAFRTPAMAATGLGLILLGLIGALVVQNRNQSEALAKLEYANSQNGNLDDIKKREAELREILESERAAAGDLTSDLETERRRRTKLEADIQELRKQVTSSKPSTDAPIVPTIGAIVLSSTAGDGGENVSLNNNQERISVKITLPSNVEPGASLTAKLNGDPVGGQMRTQTGSKGLRSITFSVSAKQVTVGINVFEVFDGKGKQIATFKVTGN